MDKRKVTFEEILIFLIFVVFPFGQILKINLLILDFLAVVSLIFYLKKEKITLEKINKANSFFIFLIFSFIFSLALFPLKELLTGFLYLVRFFAYLSLFYLVKKYLKKKKSKHILTNSLVLASVFIATFGWVQYFLYPDFRKFYIWGWDKHLYRLSGTFLDPGFTGILLVLGFILCFSLFLFEKKKIYSIPSVILFVSTLFTYSRASILVLLVGAFLILILKRKDVLRPILMTSFLLLLIFFLPRPGGIGVRLERTFSIFSRLNNYKETLLIFKKSPVFGIGFNNLCMARRTFIEKTGEMVNSCSGSDSSLLLVLSTTGVVGLMTFIVFVKKVVKNIKRNVFGNIFLISLICLFIHSLFVNSLFYPFVLAWMSILYALSVKNDLLSEIDY